MIALPGCTLAIGHEEDFHLIMDTFLEALRRNIETRKPDRMINEIDLPDIPLWTIWAIQQYRRFMGAGKCRERYGAVVRELVEHIRAGRIRNLMADTNGLLKSEGENSPVTWLSASINGRPIIPRTGYILEFNALWYNGLCFLANLYESMGRGDRIRGGNQRARRESKGIVYQHVPQRIWLPVRLCERRIHRPGGPPQHGHCHRPRILASGPAPAQTSPRLLHPRAAHSQRSPLAQPQRATITTRYMSAIQSGASMRCTRGRHAPGSSDSMPTHTSRCSAWAASRSSSEC